MSLWFFRTIAGVLLPGAFALFFTYMWRDKATPMPRFHGNIFNTLTILSLMLFVGSDNIEEDKPGAS